MTDQPPAEDRGPEPSADVLGDAPPLAAEPGRSRRRGIVFGAAATVLALVAAGGVVLSVRLAGGGRQPESLAPRSTFALFKVDLDPAANQKLAIRDFSSKFPDAPKAQAEDIIERLVAYALRNEEEIRFDEDVKPWLGRRLAIAGFTDSAGKVKSVGIVQSTDDAAARRGLQRIAERADGDDRLAYAVHKGYAVISDEQSVVDGAIRDADQSALPDNKTFRSDVDELDGDQVAVAWVDADAAVAAARKDNPELPQSLTDQFKGRLVTGVHFEGNYVQLEGLSLGTDTRQLAAAAPTVLTALPASTLAAVSVQNLAQNLERALGASQAVVAEGFIEDQIAALEEDTGLQLREDVLPLFRKEAVVTLGEVPRGSLPLIGVASQVADQEDKARTVGGRLTGLAARFQVPLKSDVKDGTFYLATPEDYVDRLQNEHGLGDNETFRLAMGELGEKVSFAAYVDLGQLLTLAENSADYDNIKPLRAFGISAGVRDDKGYFRLRLAVR